MMMGKGSENHEMISRKLDKWRKATTQSADELISGRVQGTIAEKGFVNSFSTCIELLAPPDSPWSVSALVLGVFDAQGLKYGTLAVDIAYWKIADTSETRHSPGHALSKRLKCT